MKKNQTRMQRFSVSTSPLWNGNQGYNAKGTDVCDAALFLVEGYVIIINCINNKKVPSIESFRGVMVANASRAPS